MDPPSGFGSTYSDSFEQYLHGAPYQPSRNQSVRSSYPPNAPQAMGLENTQRLSRQTPDPMNPFQGMSWCPPTGQTSYAPYPPPSIYPMPRMQQHIPRAPAEIFPASPSIPSNINFSMTNQNGSYAQTENRLPPYQFGAPVAAQFPQPPAPLTGTPVRPIRKLDRLASSLMQDNRRQALGDITNSALGHQSSPALHIDSDGNATPQLGRSRNTTATSTISTPDPVPSAQAPVRYAKPRKRKGEPRYAGNNKVADFSSLLLTHPEVVREWLDEGQYSTQEIQYLLQYYVQVAQVAGPHTVQDVMQQRSLDNLQDLHPFDHRRIFDQDPRGIPHVGSTIQGVNREDTGSSQAQPDFCDGDTTHEFVHYPRSWEQLPIGTTLRDILDRYPNHMKDEHLDGFSQQGVSGCKMWDQQASKFGKMQKDLKIAQCEDHPENFLNKRLQYRKRDILVRYGSNGWNVMCDFPVKLRDLGRDLPGRTPSQEKNGYAPDPEDAIDYHQVANSKPEIGRRHLAGPYKRNESRDAELKATRPGRMRKRKEAKTERSETPEPRSSKASVAFSVPGAGVFSSRPGSQFRDSDRAAAGRSLRGSLNPFNTAKTETGAAHTTSNASFQNNVTNPFIEFEPEIEDVYEQLTPMPPVSPERSWEDSLGFIGSQPFWSSEDQHNQHMTSMQRQKGQIIYWMKLVIQHDQFGQASDVQSMCNEMLVLLFPPRQNKNSNASLLQVLQDRRNGPQQIRHQLKEFVIQGLKQDRHGGKDLTDQIVIRAAVTRALAAQQRHWSRIQQQLVCLIAQIGHVGKHDLVQRFVSGSAEALADEALKFNNTSADIEGRKTPFTSAEPLQRALGFWIWHALNNTYKNHRVSDLVFLKACLKFIEGNKRSMGSSHQVSEEVRKLLYEAYDEIARRVAQCLAAIPPDSNRGRDPPDDDDDDLDDNDGHGRSGKQSTPSRGEARSSNKDPRRGFPKRRRDSDDDDGDVDYEPSHSSPSKKQKQSRASGCSTELSSQPQKSQTKSPGAARRASQTPTPQGSPFGVAHEAAVDADQQLDAGLAPLVGQDLQQLRNYLSSWSTSHSNAERTPNVTGGVGFCQTLPSTPSMPSAQLGNPALSSQNSGSHASNALGKRKRSDERDEETEVSNEQPAESQLKKQKQVHDSSEPVVEILPQPVEQALPASTQEPALDIPAADLPPPDFSFETNNPFDTSNMSFPNLDSFDDLDFNLGMDAFADAGTHLDSFDFNQRDDGVAGSELGLPSDVISKDLLGLQTGFDASQLPEGLEASDFDLPADPTLDQLFKPS